MNEEMDEGTEEGKDDWSLEESLEEIDESGQETPAPPPSSKEAGASGDLPLWLSIIGIAVAPLLIVSFFLAKNQLEATREMGYAPGIKLYLALLVSFIGIGLYLILVALFLVKQAGF